MPLSRHNVGTMSGNELTRNSSGNTRSQSSQLAEPLLTDPGLNSGIGVRDVTSTLKKMNWQAPKAFEREEKATTTMMAGMESEDWGLSCIIVSLPGSLRV